MAEWLRRVARLDVGEISRLPARWTNARRGRYLRRLLAARGVDPGRLFQVEYFPQPRCWLLVQQVPAGAAAPAAARLSHADFFLQTMLLLRRTALAAWSKLAAQSPHFARSGRVFPAPAAGRELSLSDLTQLLGGAGDGPAVHFTDEGGWHVEPSDN